MFESLTASLSSALNTLRGRGKLTEANMREGLSGVRTALLEADVDFKVVRQFVASVKEKAVGEVVRVKVLKIDPQNRRISLSIKALKPAPEAPAGGRGKKGEKIVGRSEEEIRKETPALRRLREKSRQMNFKGGLM